jgi:hypothetical protein
VSETEPSYRRRNLVLAAVAAIFVAAAIFKVLDTAKPEPTTGDAAGAAGLPAQPEPSAQRVPSDTPAQTGPAITAQVSFAGAGAALPAAAKVYVFIRPVGERMPLGVQTYAVGDLPVAVEFSSPNGSAEARAVEVVARLSMSGAVALQPGDVETVSSPLQFGPAPQRADLVLATSGAGAAPPAAAAAPVAAVAASGAAGDDRAGAALRIPVHLALGPGVSLPPTTTVFLIVRATDGSPMPLAVKRFAVSDLPKDLTLSEADAMVPGRSISAASAVELVARASLSGNVKPGPGDYEGRSGVLKIAEISAPVALLIDRPL